MPHDGTGGGGWRPAAGPSALLAPDEHDTYLFRTAAGSTGVLQITALDLQRETVGVRYKLVVDPSP